MNNPCIRCGKEREVFKVWKEEIYGSVITNSESRCPDSECQKIVNRENRKASEKSARYKLRYAQRVKRIHVGRKK